MVARAKLHPIAKFELDPHEKRRYHPMNNPSYDTRNLIEKYHVHKDIPQDLIDYQPKNPRFTATEQQKRMVWQMAAMGATAEIMRLAVLDPDTRLPVNINTFNGTFLEIVKHARDQANIKVALKIFELALGQDAEYDQDGNIIRPYAPPNLDALKWWDKTRNNEVKQMFGLRNVINSVVDGNGPVTLVIEGS